MSSSRRNIHFRPRVMQVHPSSFVPQRQPVPKVPVTKPSRPNKVQFQEPVVQIIPTTEEKKPANIPLQDIKPVVQEIKPVLPSPPIANTPVAEATKSLSLAQKSSTTERILLLIGINYTNTVYRLSSCYSDILDVKTLLSRRLPFKPENIYVLSDSSRQAISPTYSNILKTFAKITNEINSNKGKNYVVHFYYSGHGTVQADKNGDEKCGFDGCFVSSDLKIINDDLFNSLFLSKLPPTTTLIAATDCCFSGSIFDLQYHYDTTTSTWVENNTKTLPAKIVMISGCKELEVSYETATNGTLTAALVSSLKLKPTMTVQQLLNKILDSITDFPQHPMLSVSDKSLLDLKFIS